MIINKQFNDLLHHCLDDRIDETQIIDLIEEYCIEKTYHFYYVDDIKKSIHKGIIDLPLYNKLKIGCKKHNFFKVIWQDIKFSVNHSYPFRDTFYNEQIVKEKYFKTSSYVKIITREDNIIYRLYYFICSFPKKALTIS